MDQVPGWLLIISTISAAAVSIFSVLVPVLLERDRAKREDKKQAEAINLAEIADIDRATLDILSMISVLKLEEAEQIEAALTQPETAANVVQAITTLRARFYTWEMKIWQRLDEETRERVKKLREQIENLNVDSDVKLVLVGNYFIADYVHEWTGEILSLTRIATNRA